MSVTARCPSKDPIILTTTPTLVHVPLGCIPPSPIVSHFSGWPLYVCAWMCAPVSVPPLCGGRSCVVARDTHACVGHAQRHTRPLVCPPRPLSSLPYLLTTSTPPPLPLPLPPSLASSPPHPLSLLCRRLLPRVPPPCLPAAAAVMSAVRLAACFGPRGRVTAGLAPGCVGVTRREGPPVSKPPLSLPLPRVVPPLRRPTPPYPPLCTPPHTPLSGHRLGLS